MLDGIDGQNLHRTFRLKRTRCACALRTLGFWESHGWLCHSEGERLLKRFAIEGLSVSYYTPRPKPVVSDFSITIERGVIYAILAPSGSGKTTFFHAVAGLFADDPSVKVTNPPHWAFPQARISLVFQRPPFFEWLSLRNNLLLLQHISGSNDHSLIEHLLTAVGLIDFATYRPSELSAGMLARGSIARGLATKPRLLLLDEPFSNVDEVNKSIVMSLVRKTVIDEQLFCMFITHNPFEAAIFSDIAVIASSLPLRILDQFPLRANGGNHSLLLDDDKAISGFRTIREMIIRHWENHGKPRG